MKCRCLHWLLQVIEKCLQKDPLLRFGNGVELQDFIFHNSISPVTDVAGNEWSTTPMTTEQKWLKPEEAENSDTIRVSRPVFYAMVVLLLVMTGTLGILLFATSEPEDNPVEQVKKKPVPLAEMPAKRPIDTMLLRKHPCIANRYKGT